MTTHNGHARKITKLPICSLNQIDSDRVQVQFTQSDLGPWQVYSCCKCCMNTHHSTKKQPYDLSRHMLKVTMPSTIGFVLRLSKDSFCMIAEIVGAMKFSAVSATTRPRRNASSGILSSFSWSHTGPGFWTSYWLCGRTCFRDARAVLQKNF